MPTSFDPAKIISVTPLGKYLWQVEIQWPSGRSSYELYSKRDYPDAMAAYLASLQDIHLGLNRKDTNDDP